MQPRKKSNLLLDKMIMSISELTGTSEPLVMIRIATQYLDRAMRSDPVLRARMDERTIDFYESKNFDRATTRATYACYRDALAASEMMATAINHARRQ